MKLRILILIIAALMSTGTAYALSAKCELIGQFAAAMVQERDSGVTKKQALQKLKKAGSSNKDCIEIIKAIWSKDLKGLSEEGAYQSFGVACESAEIR